jgi:hypothetical protein
MAVEEGFAWMLEALSQLHAVSSRTGSLDWLDRVQTDRIDPPPR